MSIRAKILAACMSLIMLTVVMAGFAQTAQRELGTLATNIYDDAFMGMNYLRSAQVGFAALRTVTPTAAMVDDVLGDMAVATERAISPAGRVQAAALRQRIETMFASGTAMTDPADANAVQIGFERAVETFAADGFRYRGDVALLVDAQMRRTWLTIAALLLAAVFIAAVVSHLIATPVRRAVGVAQAIAAGCLDTPINIRGSGETGDLMRALSSMQSSIAAALARIRQLMADQAETHAGELATQHAHMQAAIGNMNQGLCLFGPDGRLAVANRRFGEMFGEPDPGATARDILGQPGLEGILDGTAGKGEVDFSCDLADGRVIAVSQRLVNCGGLVATYDDITDRRASEQRLAHMARHDALTGLPNRLMMGEHLLQAWLRSRCAGLAVLSIDLDGFKDINDTLGHTAGDTVLCTMAERLRAVAGDNGLVVRLGGDEFAVIQEGADQPYTVSALARRLIGAAAEPIEIDGQPTVLGASIGIAMWDETLTEPGALLKSADQALHRAKDEGRGAFRFFDQAMDVANQERRLLELDLRCALAEKQFEVFYQPLVDAGSGRVSGFEALLRWRRPGHGMVSPVVFIPAAEESGLIGAIGAWVLQQACADAVAWPGERKVAVNLSPAQFRNRLIVEDVAEALHASGLPAARLELEITESLLLQNDAEILATLHTLRGLGVRISMDDFGTGYSSLGYLRRFPFDKIKIDQSFVKGMTDEADCLAIVRSVIGLGRSLGISVNAEGVETEAQFAALRMEGCGEVQGYLFSRPKPLRELGDLLASRPTTRATDRAVVEA